MKGTVNLPAPALARPLPTAPALRRVVRIGAPAPLALKAMRAAALGSPCARTAQSARRAACPHLGRFVDILV